MLRKLVIFGILLTLTAPAFAQRGQGGRSQGARGQGVQLRQRIHTPGTGQQNADRIQKRDRKRDGTGLNCLNGPCAQAQTQTQTQTGTQVQTQTQNQAQSTTQSKTRTQTKTQTKTQTQTQQSNPAPKN